jgi:transketolase
MPTDAAQLGNRIRKIVLERSKQAEVGHIGSALSIADIIAVLYGRILSSEDGRDRDRFILSKGHAALAMFAALHAVGRVSADDLETYCSDGTAFGVHPEHAVAGVDFSTGSLGHGLSMGAGAALAARLQKSERAVYVLMSDAELNEGSVWEAAMFAAHHRLGALVAVVDANNQQAFGYTQAVLDLGPLEERWSAFGWNVRCVDGHDSEALTEALRRPHDAHGRPTIVIAATTFGKGVSYMEGRLEWHYLAMTDEQYEKALDELEPSITVAADLHAT